MYSLFIKQEEFASAVHSIITVCEQAKGLEKGGALPHFFYIKVEGLGDKVRLTANNMVRVIMVDIKGVSEHSPFCVGVSGLHLKNLIAAMPKGMLNMDVTEGFRISGDRSSYVLNTMHKDSFPVPALPSGYAPVDFGTMFGAFSKISYCASTKEGSRPYEKAICLLHDYAVCTDNQRLSFIPNNFVHVDPEKPILLPIESAKCLMSVFKGVATGFVCSDELMMHFHSDNVYVGTRLLEGKPPANLKSVMSQAAAHTPVTLSTDELRHALKRLISFTLSSDKTKATPGEFEFSSQSLTIRVDVNGYKAEETISVQGGVPVRMSVNMIYVYQAVKTMGELTCFEIRGPELPLVIAEAENPRQIRNIVMPHMVRRQT